MHKLYRWGSAMYRTARHLLLALLCSAGCTESTGPVTQGPPFFRATADGSPWTPGAVSTVCQDFSLVLRATPLPSDTTFLILRVADMTGVGVYSFGDVASGRFGEIYDTASTLLALTSAPDPGHLSITGIDFTDSVLAGRFAVSLRYLTDSASSIAVTGSFRLPFHSIASGNNPQGTPCHGAI